MAIPKLREFAAQAAARIEAQSGEEDAARAALQVLSEGGWLAHTVPAAWGGAAHPGVSPERVSVRALCEIRQVFAYASGMLDVMFVEQGLGSYPIALGAARERHAWAPAVLQGVIAGTTISAFALTESGAGSDLSAVATRATQSGDDWRLNGSKTFISNAGIADFYTVLARTSGEPGERGGLSMFYVPADAKGLSIERFEVMAPHPIGTLSFDDLKLRGAWLLGQEGQGLELALKTLGTFRTSVAAAALGFSRRAFDESIAHLERRQQFGRPPSEERRAGY